MSKRPIDEAEQSWNTAARRKIEAYNTLCNPLLTKKQRTEAEEEYEEAVINESRAMHRFFILVCGLG